MGRLGKSVNCAGEDVDTCDGCCSAAISMMVQSDYYSTRLLRGK